MPESWLMLQSEPHTTTTVQSTKHSNRRLFILWCISTSLDGEPSCPLYDWHNRPDALCTTACARAIPQQPTACVCTKPKNPSPCGTSSNSRELVPSPLYGEATSSPQTHPSEGFPPGHCITPERKQKGLCSAQFQKHSPPPPPSEEQLTSPVLPKAESCSTMAPVAGAASCQHFWPPRAALPKHQPQQGS